MKKRWIPVIFTVLTVFAVVGCAAKGANGTDDRSKVEVSDSAELLNKVWDTFEEEDRFAAMGGDYEHMVDNAAGLFDMGDTENLTYMLSIPADSIGLIDEAASLVHMMNANTFTGAAFHLKDAADADQLTDALKNQIAGTQWMCGFPDKMMIFTVNGGEYVVSAFGDGEIMDQFKTKLMEVYGESAALEVEENIE